MIRHVLFSHSLVILLTPLKTVMLQHAHTDSPWSRPWVCAQVQERRPRCFCAVWRWSSQPGAGCGGMFTSAALTGVRISRYLFPSQSCLFRDIADAAVPAWSILSAPVPGFLLLPEDAAPMKIATRQSIHTHIVTASVWLAQMQPWTSCRLLLEPAKS